MNDLYKTKALMQRAVCNTTSFYVWIRNKYVYCTYKYGQTDEILQNYHSTLTFSSFSSLFIIYETVQYCLEILAHHLLGVRYKWTSTEQVLWFRPGNKYLNHAKEWLHGYTESIGC